MEILIFLGMGAAITLGFGLSIRRTNRHYRWLRETLTELRQYGDLYYHDDFYGATAKFTVQTIGQQNPPEIWQPALLTVSDKRLALYELYAPQLKALFATGYHEIQGFWRPVKYEEGINEMWVHTRIGDSWHILKLRLQKHRMYKLAGALKRVGTEEQASAYRRQRPYIHRGARAHLAERTLQGAWELHQPVGLYLMPLFLVILQNSSVQRQIPLMDIQDIAALPRLDAPDAEGLIRFTVTATGETLAFAVPEYQAWADDLAQAAKRTLEAPVFQKQKGYGDDEEGME